MEEEAANKLYHTTAKDLDDFDLTISTICVANIARGAKLDPNVSLRKHSNFGRPASRAGN
jgi:hypothetical protein